MSLGTLCVIDRVPRELTENQMQSVQALSRQVMGQMELHRQLIERDILLKRLKHAVKEVKILNGLLPICAICKVIRNVKGSGCHWKRISGTGPMRNIPMGCAHPASRIYVPN